MKAIKELLFFGVAGVLGFLTDAGALYLVKPFIGVYFGRLVSFFLAVIVTWLFNRNITFKDNSASMNLISEFLHYLSLMVVGGTINLGVYYLLVGSVDQIRQWPIIAVAVGSIAGMVVNFISSRYLLYKR
ncbi:GtrA family protein [Pantoea agglomerans]|uniref:GtrA family protein n=1 Tax=Enterobacter agglomerans TaxID=549 RepID=UPI00057F2596|nr:GtrA family protein [Pantoea agglomerans]KIC86783.1 polysaccharide synthesis protein GtrA [Pantoea agglomerans]MBA5703014.1 GtrA family protein [Pantoea agglomerans]